MKQTVKILWMVFMIVVLIMAVSNVASVSGFGSETGIETEITGTIVLIEDGSVDCVGDASNC